MLQTGFQTKMETVEVFLKIEEEEENVATQFLLEAKPCSVQSEM